MSRDRLDTVSIGMAADLIEDEATLVELLDRLIDTGVVLAGDIRISVAGVDLIYLNLRALLISSEALLDRPKRGA